METRRRHCGTVELLCLNDRTEQLRLHGGLPLDEGRRVKEQRGGGVPAVAVATAVLVAYQ